MPSDVKEHRDAALRRVGRNLVNFQRLEAALKTLIPAMTLTGSASDVRVRQVQHARSLKKKSLGDLADRFHADAYGLSPLPPLPTNPAEPTFATRFHLEADPSYVHEQKKSLLSLVKERNRLVHTDLLKVDFDRTEDCDRLSKSLDEQNVRICRQLTELKWLRDVHSEFTNELKRFIDSDEFLQVLQRESGGA